MRIPDSGPGIHFRERTTAGVSWSLSASVAEKLMVVALNVCLARLLSPLDFGLFGMVAVFTGLASLVADLGFTTALIHKQEATQAHCSSVFWINVAFGLLLAGAFAAAAPAMAHFYQQPALREITWVMTFAFIVGSLAPVQFALLRKRMAFGVLSGVRIGSLAVAGGLALALAWAGFGVWSLVAQPLAGTTLTVMLLWMASDWRPTLRLDLEAVKGLLRYGGNVVAFSMVAYTLRNTDRVLIGRVLGAAPLGLYTRAYELMRLPLSTVSDAVGSVLFPALASIQEDRDRVARLYLRASRGVALITFPMMVGLWVVAEPFVSVVFGSAWLGMVPILKVLAWVGLIESIGTLNGNLYLSQGRTGLQLRVGIVFGICGLAAIFAGLSWGVLGVAYAYATYSFLVTYPSLRIAASLVNLTFAEVARNLGAVLCSSLLMGAGVWALDYILLSSWPDWIRLTIEVGAGALAYLAIVHAARLEAYHDAREAISAIGRARHRRLDAVPDGRSTVAGSARGIGRPPERLD